MRPGTHTDYRSAAGMTLIEVTIVIAVLLGLISVLFLGVSAYKEGTNRAMCIQNIYRVQTAMRVACNYNELEPGRSYDGLKDLVIGESLYIPDDPVCPSNGTYEYLEGVIPATGVTFLSCTVEGHVPKSTVGW
jgi:competence protein ComGC